MLDYVYNETKKDYELKENELERAKWLLKQDSNVYYPKIGVDKNILFSDKQLTKEVIANYFTKYLLSFNISLKGQTIKATYPVGILELKYVV